MRFISASIYVTLIKYIKIMYAHFQCFIQYYKHWDWDRYFSIIKWKFLVCSDGISINIEKYTYNLFIIRLSEMYVHIHTPHKIFHQYTLC